jgi:hypothetical protein
MSSIIKDICHSHAKLSLSGIQQTFAAVAAVFNLCLKGLTHLCRDITGRSSRGQVIYSLIRILVTVFEELHNLYHPSAINGQLVLTKQHNLRTHYVAETTLKETLMTQILAKELSILLVNLLTANEFEIKVPNKSIIELREGLLAALLQKVGRILSQVVFGEQVASSTLLGHISAAEKEDFDRTELNAAQLEAQHLGWVLERLKAWNDQNPHMAILLAKVLTKGEDTSKVGSGYLLNAANQRLQHTLLKEVFGEDGQEFIKALKIPVYDSEESPLEAIPIKGRSTDAFVESVWASVGWDMLKEI